MIGAHTAPVGDQRGTGIDVMGEGNDLPENILLVLLVPYDPVTGRAPVTVETLGIDTVDAAELEPAVVDLIPDRVNKAPVFIIIEPANSGRKYNYSGSTPTVLEQFHITTKMRAVPFVIFPVHADTIQRALQYSMEVA
jgi:hypothetical protein